jgi:hypothetical protein
MLVLELEKGVERAGSLREARKRRPRRPVVALDMLLAHAPGSVFLLVRKLGARPESLSL